MQDVRKEVNSLAGHWDGVACCLGLTKDSVCTIKLKCRGDPSRCLDEVIDNWLKQNYNCDKFGLPSWRRLVSAVADDSGGKNRALAKTIAKKYGLSSTSGQSEVLAKRIAKKNPISEYIKVGEEGVWL